MPESVAQLTGGEYFAFKDATTLSRHLIPISNDVPNYYVLSFSPQSPHPGSMRWNEPQGQTRSPTERPQSVLGGRRKRREQ